MNYNISVTNLAMHDLANITRYISEELCNPTAATSLLDTIDDCYKNLETMPMMFERCNNSRLRDMGYRRAVIKNYIMVYRIAESERTVYILRFFYGAQEYEKLI
ncbi:MAG: type II toxin-antitoxin system RelE/ParE family toxin [Clostridiaceae bacterium]|nr:type II toxin-antitoxin system RelE/ParE family toxin [Clostridiaceae bacterium]